MVDGLSVASDEKFVELLVEAIVNTAVRIQDAHPAEHVTGYALCTDDSLSTLSHVACTAEFCLRHDVPGVQYSAVEWEYNEGFEAFDHLRNLLQSRYEVALSQDAFERHVSDAFNDLVIALGRARDVGTFGVEVLVYATSTDPGPALETLALEGVVRLNAPSLVAGWKEAMGYSGASSEADDA